jgi:hypothetical protein
MAGIKNWTVTAKTIGTIEAAVSYAAYLEDETHPRHTETDIIEILGDAKKLVYKACVNAEARREQNRCSKGGRPPAFLVTFNFVLPTPLKLRPSKRHWQMIAKDILKAVSKRFDIPMKELVNNCFMNVHNQSNSHLNLAFSNVWETSDGKFFTVRSLKQRAFLEALKKAFTDSANRVLEIDNKAYMPMQSGVGSRVDIRRALEELSVQKTNQDDFIRSQSKRLKKLDHAVELEDQKQSNRQLNRIARDFSEDPVIQSKLKRLLIQYSESSPSRALPEQRDPDSEALKNSQRKMRPK